MRTLDRYIVGGLGTLTVDGAVYINTEALLKTWRSKRVAQRKTQGLAR